jgi:hypothetical protein
MEVNQFDSDVHRRVAAHCTRPISALEIAYSFGRDPNVPEEFRQPSAVEEILQELEADGLVKNFGVLEGAAAALKQQDADDEVLDFYGDPDVWVKRADHPLRFPFLDRGDHFVMTKKNHAKLTGPAYAPGEGPVGEDGPQRITAADFAKEN